MRAHPAALIHAELAVAPGDVIRAPRRRARTGWALVAVGADTPEEAQELARTLDTSVRFVMKPLSD